MLSTETCSSFLEFIDDQGRGLGSVVAGPHATRQHDDADSVLFRAHLILHGVCGHGSGPGPALVLSCHGR